MKSGFGDGSGPEAAAISAYPPFGKFTNAYSTVFDRTACGGVCLWGKQKMQDTKRKIAFWSLKKV